MDVRSTSLYETFIYDPSIHTYDTTNIFNTTSGTPTVVGSDLRFNADGCNTLNTGLYGRYTFTIKNAVAPVAGQNKIWGLQTTSLGNLGSMVFDITAALFTFMIHDNVTGNVIEIFTIPWDADWTGEYTSFIIDWQPDAVSVSIGLADERPVTFKTWKLTDHADMPILPQAVYIDNADADNFDLKYLMVQGAHKWTKPY